MLEKGAGITGTFFYPAPFASGGVAEGVSANLAGIFGSPIAL